MDDVKVLLRQVFQTANELTIPVSGTGSAGMEAALVNFLEPGDPVLVCVAGYFGRTDGRDCLAHRCRLATN